MTAPARPLVADVTGTGPAVVLLHGQPGRAGDWGRVVARLSGRYTTVTPDRLGYGRTGGPAGDFAANAAAVVALLDRLGVERAVVAGHSWAGAVALQLAVAHPARVAGVVLVASVAPGDAIGHLDRLLATRPVGDLAALATLGVAGRAMALIGLRRLAGLRHLADRLLPAGARDLLAQSAPTAGAWRAFAAEQRAFVTQIDALGAHLGAIAAPTAVLAGTADHVVGPDAGRLLTAAIPGAVLDPVPGAGHLLAWEHPDAVATAVDSVATRERPYEGKR